MSLNGRRASGPAALGAVLVVALSACSGSGTSSGTSAVGATSRGAVEGASDSHPVAVQAGLQGCGSGWSGGAAGTWSFHVTNTSVGGMDVYLADSSTDPATARVFLELEAVGAGASADGSVTLAGGRYRFVCLPADEDPVLGPVQRVAGGAVAGATPGIVPITQADLVPPTQAYEAWVASHLAVLAKQVRALDADVARGDLARARTAWLTAHSTYGTLGGAYDAFGELGDAIDGLPAPGRTALDDTGLTGFRRVEALLWSHRPASVVRPVTRGLVKDVDRLRATFGAAQIDPTDLGIRAHEILEDTLQVDLRGVADGASGTTLAEAAANVRGARRPLAALRPLLTARGVDLGPVDASLDSLAATLAGYDHGGRWTPRPDLTTSEREHLDAQVDEAVELLANVAALTDPRRAL
jgi:iron uptake system component EfeO